jgi:hypothetical protein
LWYDQEIQLEKISSGFWYSGQVRVSLPNAIKKTLDILGIQIEGINKEESK